MNLTTPQRNTLLAVFRVHPAAYEIRGAAVLARRLCEAGLAVEIEGTKPLRRFQLTPKGVERGSRLAARRIADHVEVATGGRGAGAGTKGPAGGEIAAGVLPVPRPKGMPEVWPFPVSAHAWEADPPCLTPAQELHLLSALADYPSACFTISIPDGETLRKAGLMKFGAPAASGLSYLLTDRGLEHARGLKANKEVQAPRLFDLVAPTR